MKRAINRCGVSIVVMLLLALFAVPALAQNKNAGPRANTSPGELKGSKPAGHNSKRSDNPLSKKPPAAPRPDNSGDDSTTPDDKAKGREQTPESPVNNQTSGSKDSSLISSPVLLIVAAAFVVLLMLALHVFHLVGAARMKQEMADTPARLTHLHQKMQQMNESLQNLSTRASAPAPTPNPANGDFATLAAQQHRVIEQLGESLEDVRRQTLDNRQNLQSTINALALHAQLAGEARLRREEQKAASEGLEAERAQAVALNEKYRDVFAAHANAVKPLVEAFAAFSDHVKQRTHLPPEWASGLQTLEGEIRQFDHWLAEIDGRLANLRRGSIRERLHQFRSGEQRLGESFNLGEVSILHYIKEYNALMQELLADDGYASDARLSLTDQESQYKKLSANAPDYLMNWFDKLFQLQMQLNAATISVDAQTSEKLAFVQNLAKDALGRFDIQPEEIQAGRTSFDNRLYDAAMVTQSSQYPANTVIGVQQCGFRRCSTGEVLRRPKVIVAGLGVAS
jgi:hypothetical protein